MRNPLSPPRRTPHRAAAGALAVALAFAVLAAAAPAASQTGSLRFDSVTAESCNEMGSCEVRLACQLAGGAEIELVPEVVIAADATHDIGRTEAVARFPVTVSCKVWEDDGWFGSSWEEAGSGSVTVPAGGTYRVELGNAEQVQVAVQLSADSLEGPPAGGTAAGPAAGRGGKAPPTPAGRRYSGTFRSNPDAGHAVVLGLDGAAFRNRYKDLTDKGLRLTDVETYNEGTKRVWSGIFRSAAASNEGHELATGLEWEAFVEKTEELRGKSQVAVDLETYVEGKKRLFAAVFRETTDPDALWVGEEEKVFTNKVNEFTGQGLRLIDVEAYRSGNKLLYAGVFLKGIGSFGMTTGLDWPALQAKVQDASGKGQRLADFESYEDGGKRKYVSVLRGGSDKSELVGDLAWNDFAARWRQLTGQGLRLVDLESLPE